MYNHCCSTRVIMLLRNVLDTNGEGVGWGASSTFGDLFLVEIWGAKSRFFVYWWNMWVKWRQCSHLTSVASSGSEVNAFPSTVCRFTCSVSQIHGGEESRHEVLRWHHVQLVFGGEWEFLDLHCKDTKNYRLLDNKGHYFLTLVKYLDYV